MPTLQCLNPRHIESWKRDGVLILRSGEVFDTREVDRFVHWTTEIEQWPEVPGKWMKYFEASLKDGSRILNRVENFFPYQPDLQAFFDGSWMKGLVGQLFGEPAAVFKEKINFKYPGGGDFKAHQDAQGGVWDQYGHSLYITALITVDAATLANGCLEVVRGRHLEGLFGPKEAPIPEDVVATFDWEQVETAPGDIVFFDSYVPHRSGPNYTNRPRRVLYVTYNKHSEGEVRERYFADKRKSFPPDCEREAGKQYQYKV